MVPRQPGMAATIKRATSEEHGLAERAVERFAPFSSRDRYADYLSKLHGFYYALEPRLAVHLELKGRAKLPLIQQDLAALGRGFHHLPACSRLPALRTRAAAFGVAYVLEGKTLGARFLLAEAESRLSLSDGVAFLAGYGPRTAFMWKEFRSSLEDFTSRNGQRRTTLNAALATFRSFRAWLGDSA